MSREAAVQSRFQQILFGQAQVALMVFSITQRTGVRMNRYGLRAKAHWEQFRPSAYAQLEDPGMYFTEMGEDIAGMVADLIPQLAGKDVPGESYLEKVARLNSAKSQAEEIATHECGMYPEPELSRTEWEDTTGETDINLIDWAFHMKMQEEGLEDFHLDWEESQRRWLLPMTFLEGMARAAAPLEYLEEHEQVWLASVEARWRRASEQTQQ